MGGYICLKWTGGGVGQKLYKLWFLAKLYNAPQEATKVKHCVVKRAEKVRLFVRTVIESLIKVSKPGILKKV